MRSELDTEVGAAEAEHDALLADYVRNRRNRPAVDKALDAADVRLWCLSQEQRDLELQDRATRR